MAETSWDRLATWGRRVAALLASPGPSGSGPTPHIASRKAGVGMAVNSGGLEAGPPLRHGGAIPPSPCVSPAPRVETNVNGVGRNRTAGQPNASPSYRRWAGATISLGEFAGKGADPAASGFSVRPQHYKRLPPGQTGGARGLNNGVPADRAGPRMIRERWCSKPERLFLRDRCRGQWVLGLPGLLWSGTSGSAAGRCGRRAAGRRPVLTFL